jgi:hypothetical protein
MSDVTTTVDTYLDAWNETDAARRAELIDEVWATNGRLIDPPLASEGHTGISDHMAALQTQFPGHWFRRTSGVDMHHDHFRVAWELVAPDTSVALAGLDVGELAPDGRLQRVTGFFGPPPADESAA